MLQAAKDTLYWKGKTSPLQPVLIRKFSFLLSSKVLAHYHSLIFLFFLLLVTFGRSSAELQTYSNIQPNLVFHLWPGLVSDLSAVFSGDLECFDLWFLNLFFKFQNFQLQFKQVQLSLTLKCRIHPQNLLFVWWLTPWTGLTEIDGTSTQTLAELPAVWPDTKQAGSRVSVLAAATVTL